MAETAARKIMSNMKMSQIAKAVVLASTVTFAGLGGMPAQAAAPMAKFSAPGFFRTTLGDFEVTALSDGTVDLPVDQLLQEDPAKTKQALKKQFLKTPLESSVNAYLINTGNKLILIDAGAGSLFGPTLGKLLANLKASGYDASQVDEIYLTHLHPDHVGGLAANGVATFPNATIRTDQRESDYWLSQANQDKAPAGMKGLFQGATASLTPYVNAHKYLPFSGDTELASGIKSIASYGHTAGHTSYVIESQGQKLVVIGDLIHVTAVQLENPSVTFGYDADAKVAASTRNKVFAELAKEGDLVAAAHIQFPGLGHLKAGEKSYQWIPVNYTQAR
jgi:glyoxylase-like metal-dependent hydrolase (beta-lactamase superfamily II)